MSAKIITKDLMDYFYEKNGWLYWKNDRGSNKVKDSVAGCLSNEGYYVVGINGKSYLNHRILYQFYHNIILESTDILDHHDRNPQNNSKENLRLDPNYQNQQNTKTYKNNKSTGVKNISKCTNKVGNEYYLIKIYKNKKPVFSEYYRTDKFTIEELIKIRDEELLRHHGKFHSLG